MGGMVGAPHTSIPGLGGVQSLWWIFGKGRFIHRARGPRPTTQARVISPLQARPIAMSFSSAFAESKKGCLVWHPYSRLCC